MAATYPLAPQGVFRTVQGEGDLLGVPMIFIRFAGCSVGCPECDTDYRVSSRKAADRIVREVLPLLSGERWVWVTGGEPLDYDLHALLSGLKEADCKVALATSGHHRLPADYEVDFLSVSPHSMRSWVQFRGDELKLVFGLNGLRPEDCIDRLARPPAIDFRHLFVAPLDGSPQAVKDCERWLDLYPNWRMTVQAHKRWGML